MATYRRLAATRGIGRQERGHGRLGRPLVGRIERALRQVGRFGHVRLFIQDGRVCRIEVVQSRRVLRPGQRAERPELGRPWHHR